MLIETLGTEPIDSKPLGARGGRIDDNGNCVNLLVLDVSTSDRVMVAATEESGASLGSLSIKPIEVEFLSGVAGRRSVPSLFTLQP
ncbi:MAG: hypothetical protein AB8G14_18880 [Ilumatobacter sp.]